jgi:hypothetical protein
LGLLLGMRHALEPDHLAAVSTMIDARGARRSAGVLGASWGLGHSLALLVVGCVLAALDATLPRALADGFELLVAFMLVSLGLRALFGARSAAHAGPPEHVHLGRWALARRPLVVGMVHGLAGSGALTALAVAAMPTLAMRLVYTALFGVGSLVGMAILTGLVEWPIARLGRSDQLTRWLSGLTGAASVLLGGGWGWRTVQTILRGPS